MKKTKTKTEEEIKDIILAWAIRRGIFLGYDAINDLSNDIFEIFPKLGGGCEDNVRML